MSKPVSARAQLVVLVLAALMLPVRGVAQVPRGERRAPRAQIMRSTEGRYGRPIHDGMPEIKAGFTFCRLWYDADRRMDSGLGWSTDLAVIGCLAGGHGRDAG